ncbi:antitoxin VbhA family protein [Candidatus Stoquefichus massiliensis]|uniref:antitoxin VbhA family protein n=1 Tax=Candidatus Stoquefichus massiliensis TaxID=1470350 RepID=UPI0004B8F59C|nr:antitoxin VbhA family protein [Candidatus Stoquefichus massiliensis]
MSEETRKIIDEVNATMRLEGMPLTDDDLEMLRKCLEGESTFDFERQRIFKEIALSNV